MNIKIAALSFCKSQELCELALKSFPEAEFWNFAYEASSQELIDFLQGADAAIIGKEKIDEHVLTSCPSLKRISKYGVGLDNIDLEACKKLGVNVISSPGVNKFAVAEMTMAFMISLCRNMYQTSIQLKAGTWNKNGGNSIFSQTVGIIGFGNVGQLVAKFLKPLGCKVLVNDIVDFNQEDFPDVRFVEKSQIYSEADIVSLHVPLTGETQGLIGEREFELMGKDSILINTSRGAVIKQAALKHALMNDVIKAAAIDVYEAEPCDDEELLGLTNLYCTPHIGGNSKEAIMLMGEMAIGNLTA